FFFFFQAEDGIRDFHVTGVQTCALPIFSSVLASAFTILFLFWSITLFGRKLLKVPVSEPIPTDKAWLLFGSGLVGALAYTFCDSFWFSAVEAEVYAMSSFFTAFVVWAMMKWDLIEDESKANRWLILIF